MVIADFKVRGETLKVALFSDEGEYTVDVGRRVIPVRAQRQGDRVILVETGKGRAIGNLRDPRMKRR